MEVTDVVKGVVDKVLIPVAVVFEVGVVAVVVAVDVVAGGSSLKMMYLVSSMETVIPPIWTGLNSKAPLDFSLHEGNPE